MLASAYLPGDAEAPTPELVELVARCAAEGWELVVSTDSNAHHTIWGSAKTNQRGTQPRVASVRNSTSLKHLCGATILTPGFALTAAHCVPHQAQQYIVQLNNYCGDEKPRAEVLGVIIHPSYNKVSRSHDIALLQIQLDVDDITWLADDVLPNSSFGISGECIIYGYGSKEATSEVTSEVLLAGRVWLVSLDECSEALGPIAPKSGDGLICALGDRTDACQGDSGSPLICDDEIQGLSSYGLSCGVPGMPGVYSSIGVNIHWIHEVINDK